MIIQSSLEKQEKLKDSHYLTWRFAVKVQYVNNKMKNNLIYRYTMECYAAIKKNDSVGSERLMNLEPVSTEEVNQKGKTIIVYYHIYGI